VNGLRDVLLFGNSFGSEVAAETAPRLGEACRGVALGAPTPDPSARSLPRQLVRMLRVGLRAPPPLLRLALRDYARTGVRCLLREGLAALDEPICERLRALDLPVTIVRGSHDPVVPQRWAQEAAALARARLVVVPGAGHAAPWEEPGAVAGAVLELAGVSAAPRAARALP